MPDSALARKQTSIYRKIGQGEKERDTEAKEKREKERKGEKYMERKTEGRREKGKRISEYYSGKDVSIELCRTQ